MVGNVAKKVRRNRGVVQFQFLEQRILRQGPERRAQRVDARRLVMDRKGSGCPSLTEQGVQVLTERALDAQSLQQGQTLTQAANAVCQRQTVLAPPLAPLDGGIEVLEIQAI